jgi:hypothetical protein
MEIEDVQNKRAKKLRFVSQFPETPRGFREWLQQTLHLGFYAPISPARAVPGSVFQVRRLGKAMASDHGPVPDHRQREHSYSRCFGLAQHGHAYFVPLAVG